MKRQEMLDICVHNNLFDIPVEIESLDYHYYHDSGLDFNNKDHRMQAFECHCGSSFCRGEVEDGRRQCQILRAVRGRSVIC